jgi:hypothetical protein
VEPIITFANENQAVLVVTVIVLIPIMFMYQSKSAPILFHSIEYCLYMSVAHTLIYAVVQIVAWYKSQTPDINGLSPIPYNTPINPISQNFFDKTMYNPIGLLYFETLVALGLLYIVVIVRPTSYTSTNKYKGNKERGMSEKDGASRSKSRYNRSKAAGHRNQKS